MLYRTSEEAANKAFLTNYKAGISLLRINPPSVRAVKKPPLFIFGPELVHCIALPKAVVSYPTCPSPILHILSPRRRKLRYYILSTSSLSIYERLSHFAMEDDTGQGCPPFGSGDIEQAKALWKFRINREEAQEWASQEIQFLVYDNTDDATSPSAQLTCSGDEDADADRPRSRDSGSLRQSQVTAPPSANRFADSPEDADIQRAIWESLNGATNAHQSRASVDATELDASDPETDEEELQEAIRLSLQSDEGDDNSPPQSSPGSTSGRHGRRPTCRICPTVPAFPHDRKTRKFRIFKPAEELTGVEGLVGWCTHYVAVSYCWPEQVLDEHGKTVPAVINSQVRDLDGSQRRARALDHVLDAAVDFANSCGLRMIWIDQECLPQPQSDDTPSKDEIRYKQLGVQAMDSVYNKAMVTMGLHAYHVTSQREATAIRVWSQYAKNPGQYVPNRDMVDGLIDFLEGVQKDRWYTRAWVIQEAISSGFNLFLTFPKAPGILWPSSSYRLSGERGAPAHPLDTGKRVLDSELIMIPVDEFQAIVGAARALLERRFQPVGGLLLFRPEVAYPILKKAERLHPKVNTRQDPWDINIRSTRIYGPRRRVDAATAVTLLNQRGCRDVQDRVTIVANMCDYEIRLNTGDVAQHCGSLRIGYLAISLLNGDLSLLVPELFEELQDDIEIALPPEGSQMRSLFSPFDMNSHLLNHTTLQEGCLVMPRLLTHSYEENQREGLQFPAYGWTVDSMLDLSMLKYEYAELWQSLKCVQLVFHRVKQESEDDHRTRVEALGRHFGREEVMKAAKRELLHHGTIAPGSPVWGGMDSTGVEVVAILNAYRVEAEAAMQEIVAKIVFAILRYLHALSTTQSIGVANSIWQSLRVDAVDKPRGSGARDIPDTVGDELFTHPDVVKAPFHTLQFDRSRDGSYHQVWLIDRIMYQGFLWTGTYRHASKVVPTRSRPSASEDLDEDKPPETGFGDTILDRQFQRRHMATLFLAQGKIDRKKSTETTVNSGTLTYFCEGVAPGSCFSAEAEYARRKERVAAFDVDGPCIIATPFNHEWEVLPHPALRSMSVCWVVEPVKKLVPNNRQAQSDNGEGMSTQVARKGKEPATARDMEDTSDSETSGDDQPEPRVRTEDEDTLFQVVNKVKGVWQIMDPMFQLYSFV